MLGNVMKGILALVVAFGSLASATFFVVALTAAICIGTLIHVRGLVRSLDGDTQEQTRITAGLIEKVESVDHRVQR